MTLDVRYVPALALLLIGLVFGLVAGPMVYPTLGFKIAMGYLSALITCSGYLLYIASMYSGERNSPEPHPLSWTLWGILTMTGWLIQENSGAAAGSWCLGLSAAFCFLLAALSFRKYSWRFERSEWAWTLGGISIFLVYLFTDAPALSATLATLADLAGYGPTIKKAWKRPYSDSALNFTFNSVKCIPALFALSSWTWANYIYLFMLLVMNGGVVIILLSRRTYDRQRPGCRSCR